MCRVDLHLPQHERLHMHNLCPPTIRQAGSARSACTTPASSRRSWKRTLTRSSPTRHRTDVGMWVVWWAATIASGEFNTLRNAPAVRREAQQRWHWNVNRNDDSCDVKRTERILTTASMQTSKDKQLTSSRTRACLPLARHRRRARPIVGVVDILPQKTAQTVLRNGVPSRVRSSSPISSYPHTAHVAG